MRYLLTILAIFLSVVVLLPSCSTRYKTNAEMLSREKRNKRRPSYSVKKKKKEKYLSRRKGRLDKSMPDPFGGKRRFKQRNTRNSTGIYHKPKQKNGVTTKKKYSTTKRTKRHLRKSGRKIGKEDKRLSSRNKKTKRDRNKNLKKPKKGLFR
jgi:hypothetical protein